MGGRNAKVFSCASGGGEVDLSLESTCVWKMCDYGNMGIWEYGIYWTGVKRGFLLQPVVKVLEVGSRFVGKVKE